MAVDLSRMHVRVRLVLACLVGVLIPVCSACVLSLSCVSEVVYRFGSTLLWSWRNSAVVFFVLMASLSLCLSPLLSLSLPPSFHPAQQPQEYHDHDQSHPQFHRHLHQPPLSPSRGQQTRWAPAPIISTENGTDAHNARDEEIRRPRLTWSAGDGRSLPRGTVAPEAPASPPHYSLGEAGGGGLEGRAPASDLGGDGRSTLGQLPGGAGQSCRPRSATEGPAGGGGGDGAESGGGRGLFLSSRDSRRCGPG